MCVFCFALFVFLAILGLLYFPIEFRIKSTISAKRPFWDFDEDCVGFRDHIEEHCRLDNS